MTRYLVDVYKVEVPDNVRAQSDITEATEDALHRPSDYQYQLQGDSLQEIAEKLRAK